MGGNPQNRSPQAKKKSHPGLFGGGGGGLGGALYFFLGRGPRKTFLEYKRIELPIYSAQKSKITRDNKSHRHATFQR